MKLQHLLAGALGAIAAACAPPAPLTPPAPSEIVKTVLAGPLNEPVDLDVQPDGSVFVAERMGRVLLWREGAEIAEIAKFDTLFKSTVQENAEFGLLAIAADPNYAQNGFVYVMYDTKPGDVIEQRVSRFHVADGRFDMASEKVLLFIPQDDNCCHTGGAIRFNADGLLHIATGDNTNPWESEGYGPMDARPDRAYVDALRSAGNTNDLRGKILRIRPTADGGYEIPEGNLFSEAAQGRPEIYVMGARNPYTMSIDSKTGVLYYGDVGPDANEDSETRGPRGYDEVNRITEASNMGWPLFIGDNYPYRSWNAATKQAGAPFDPAHPVNASPRNTGARELPPARPALIYYPYGASEQFPLLGDGGRNALVAGVYRRPRNAPDRALPRYYEGKLFTADFMRNWVMATTLDESGKVASMERFAPEVTLSAPLDFEFGPDGALYVVEYGQGWFTANKDSALSRIEFRAAK
jgi:cytochrome c